MLPKDPNVELLSEIVPVVTVMKKVAKAMRLANTKVASMVLIHEHGNRPDPSKEPIPVSML